MRGTTSVPTRRPGLPLEVRTERTTALAITLDAFYFEHRRCGELDAGVEDDRVLMTCTCGAEITRTLEPGGRPREGVAADDPDPRARAEAPPAVKLPHLDRAPHNRGRARLGLLPRLVADLSVVEM